ncbi:MAG: AI-2E family transporter [Cyclobacteriaceae bacterium]
MKQNNNSNADLNNYSKLLEIIIRLVMLALMAFWCFQILQPFMTIILWGIIISIALNPGYQWLRKRLKIRAGLVSLIIIIVSLAIFIIPSVILTNSLIDGVQWFNRAYQQGGFEIPEPNPGIADLPLIGGYLMDLWVKASENLESVFIEYGEQLRAAGGWILSLITGTGKALLEIVVALIIAGVILVNASKGESIARLAFGKLAGSKGVEFVKVSERTVRNVVVGILGVAILQAILAGAGFAFGRVPGAGIWAFICLFLSIIQVGIVPVVLPVVIYLFYTTDSLTATLITIWLIIATLTDNILKPFVLGRGAAVPMMVIFLGAIGGFISSGFIGLFTGSLILSISYILVKLWLTDEVKETEKPYGDGFFE